MVTKVEKHFKNKSENVRKIFDKLLEKVMGIGPVNVYAVKSAIFLKTSSSFLEIKVRKKFVEINFCLGREVNEFPVSKFQRLSKNRVAHTIHIDHPDEIDKQMITWLKEAYLLIN
ncbi:MAG: hypothetical protein A2W91_10450 [Bacteroidetes bacterium GWF2_38_335]|nr:MAG: hypothetical protein A2W91_10450 [Bacteroidetes bacterium GWF2_38_335]OFY81876.1 MAG: hypothetical protein A2281_06590 [Bacteroidetes bacterium RIFOXYA12_FULL_38_20]HBS87953.1 hypothetical protein [Bacteroidales bacterium]